MSEFKIDNSSFIYNNEKITIISGAIHYFRIMPEYWEDRLLKLKACGFNTVETYIPWNFHEPSAGEFYFEGMADVVSFLRLAQKLELLVIVRPSPYICSEWDFGGLPSWLLTDPDIRFRCYNMPYLSKIDTYYDKLIPMLIPLLCTNGGPVIAVQIENEYGSYGNDSRYIEYLKDALICRGIDVLLFTSDGDTDFMLQGGTLPDILKTVNFASNPEAAFSKLKEYQKDMPLMCAEFWNGWFDHWSEEHHTRDAADVAGAFEEMLNMGASVNFYMFHGGTNFGFYNGANFFDNYEPTITSYDSHALLDESGVPTDKYYAVKNVIAKHFKIDDTMMPSPIDKVIYSDIYMTEKAEIFQSLDLISTVIKSVCPEPMESFGQDYGFILYETFVKGPRYGNELIVQDLHDRALIFVNGKYTGVLERWNSDNMILFDIAEGGAKISILVENLGRVNYGHHLRDFKGITEGVRLGNQFLYHWDIYCLPLNNISALKFRNIYTETAEQVRYEVVAQPTQTPAFYRGIFNVITPADTFISTEGWTKGVVYINGFNLGRYWNIGPQKALYLPAPLLHTGTNEIVIFELHETLAIKAEEHTEVPVVKFTSSAYL